MANEDRGNGRDLDGRGVLHDGEEAWPGLKWWEPALFIVAGIGSAIVVLHVMLSTTRLDAYQAEYTLHNQQIGPASSNSNEPLSPLSSELDGTGSLKRGKR